MRRARPAPRAGSQTETGLATTEQAEYNNAKRTTEVSDNGDRIHLREGSERAYGENPGGQVRQLEESAGRDQSRNVQTGPNGEYADGTYIPLRRNTPTVLIEEIQKYDNSEKIENLPIAMNVGKARQAMEENIGDGGDCQHSAGVDGMLQIIKGMDDPAYIVKQENGRYVEVVRYFDGKKHSAWAVLDFGEMKKHDLLNGYNGGAFNVLVTAFEPDNLRNYMQNNVEAVIYEKTKDAPQRGSGRQWPSHLNGAPFKENITDTAEKGKENFATMSDAETA